MTVGLVVQLSLEGFVRGVFPLGDKAMSKPYYTLCTLEDGLWWPQFGDYRFNTIRDEAIDSYQDYTICFIETNNKQSSVNATVNQLNLGIISPVKYVVSKLERKLNKVKK